VFLQSEHLSNLDTPSLFPHMPHASLDGPARTAPVPASMPRAALLMSAAAPPAPEPSRADEMRSATSAPDAAGL